MTEAVIIAGVVLVVAAVVGAGLVLVRRTVSQQLLARHTDVVGYVYQGVGVIYGVILAFVVIAAWEEYGDAQSATVDEATAVLNLARMANGWPARDRAGMEEALTAYAPGGRGRVARHGAG